MGIKFLKKTLELLHGLAALALLVASVTASATQVYLIQDGLHSASAGSTSNLRFDGSADGTIASDATWDWNAGTGILTQTGGTLRSTRTGSGGNSTTTLLYSDIVTGLILNTVTGTTTAASYQCIEGNFASLTGANQCGNYSQGFNNIDESTRFYNVGGDANCINITTGGDDAVPTTGPLPINGGTRGLAERGATAGCLAHVGARDMVNIFSDTTGTGGNVTLWNAIGGISGVPAVCVGIPGPTSTACNGAHWMTFSVVPVPGAVWLFGSAVGLLGVARRRRQ